MEKLPNMMIWIGWPEPKVDSDLDELYEALNNELQLLRNTTKR
jgi:hypothetical protein